MAVDADTTNRRRQRVTAAVLALALWGGTALPPKARAAEFTAAEALVLRLGEQRTLEMPEGVERVAIAAPDKLDATVLRGAGGRGAQVVITPRAPGATTLTLWPRGGGAAHVWQVRVRPAGLVLDQHFESLPQHAAALAEAAAGAGKDGVVVDRSVVAVASDTVQVDVRLVEFSRSTLRAVGLNIFSGGANSHGFSFGVYSPGSAVSTDASNSPIASALNLVLNWSNAWGGKGLGANLSLIESNGLARVLAAPTLVAHSGQSASFLAGGELPVPVSSGLGTTSIEWKPFGVGLQLTPTVLAADRIALKVAPEASDLDYGNAVTVNGVSVPALTTRRADTTVELGDGQSFVIGGLVSRSTSSSVDKVPLLGDLPVIGAFFKQVKYSRDEKELVIVVTPHLVKPIAATVDIDGALPGARRERPDAASVWGKYLLGGLDTQQALPGFSR